MERLYQKIGKFYSAAEIIILAGDLGIYVPQNSDSISMARELFLGAQRNLRLDVLFREVYSRNPGANMDLRPNLYELIAGTFNEEEAVQLASSLGLDRVNSELNRKGFFGWTHDDYIKTNKAKTLQKTAENQGKFENLLAEMKRIRPSLDLTIFESDGSGGQSSALEEDSSPPAKQGSQSSIGPSQPVPPVIHQYLGDIVYGDKLGGDKTGGDKVGGNVFKDINISDVKGSAISFGGDSSVKTDIINSPGGASSEREALITLLDRISQDMAAIKAQLDEDEAADMADELEEVRQELEKGQPSSRRIARKLNNVAEIAGAAGVAAAALNQLGSHIAQAVQLVKNLFGG